MDYLKIEVAEKLAGKRLDRRRKYFIWDGDVCFAAKFTSICTGCASEDPYVYEQKGGGCFECGYTGKRRDSVPIPVKMIKRKVTVGGKYE